LQGGSFLSVDTPRNLPNQSVDELEKKIMNLQRSTRTMLPFFTRIHNWLRMHSQWYYNWHLKSNASKIHKTVAIAYAIGMLLTFINFTLYYSVQTVQAAAVTWDGGGTDGTCGGNAGDGNKWSCAANWSGDVLPTSADAVTFNSTSTKDATVDASFAGVITSLNIASGYTGTITLARSLQTTSTFTQAAGTFTAGSQTLDVDSTFSLTAGTFNASSNTMTFAANFSITGTPTFNHNSGMITFDGASGTLTCTGATFNLVTFNHSSTKTISSTCALPLGASPTLAGAGSITNNGTLSGTGTLTKTSGTLTMNTGATLSGFNDLNTSSFTNAGATTDLSSYSTFVTSGTVSISTGSLTLPNGADLNGNLTISGGTFNAPSGTMTLAGILTVSGSPTFNANGGTFTFDSTTSRTHSCGNITFNLVNFNNAAFTVFSSNCTIPLGNNPSIEAGRNLSVAGLLTGTGTLTTAGTLAFTAGAGLSGFDGLVVGSTFTVGGASLDLGAYTTVDFNNSFNLTSGSFTAPSGTMTLANSITYTAGTFNHNNGLAILDGGGGGTINCGAMAFNRVQFNHSASAKVISAGCTLPLGADPTITGTVTLSGTLSGTGTLTQDNNNLTVSTGGALSGFTGFSKGNTGNLIIAGADLDFSAYTTATFNAFTLTTGSFIAPAGTMSTNGTFTVNGGTFNANGGTVALIGSGTATCTGGVTFNKVAITHTVNTRTFVNCTVPLGTDPASIYQTSLTNSTLTGSGTLTHYGSMSLGSDSHITGFSNFVSNSTFTVAGADIDFGNFQSVDLNSTFNLTAGTFKAPATGSFTVGATMTITGGTFDHNNGVVLFDGGGSAISCNNATFNRVDVESSGTKTFNPDCTMPFGSNPVIRGGISLKGHITGSGRLISDSGGFTIADGGSISGLNAITTNGVFQINGGTADFGSYDNMDINGDLVLAGGTFIAPKTLSVSGNFTRTSGVFVHNNGSVDLDGNNQTIIGSNSFYNLSKAPQGAAVLTITGDTIQTVKGSLVLTGKASDRRLRLLSSTTGSRWQIDAQGARNIRNVEIRDGFAINSRKINVTSGSLNSGNNSGWNWYVPSLTNLGPANLIDGSTGASSQPALTFTSTDQDAGDTSAYMIQIDDSNDFSSVVTEYSSATLSGGSKSFTVGQDAGSGSYTTGSSGQKLSDGSYYWRVKGTDNNGAVSDWVYANTIGPSFTVGSKTTNTAAPVTTTGTSEASNGSGETATTGGTSTTAQPTEQIKVDVAIKVLDDDQKPVVGAQVTLHSEPRYATTDDKGVANFKDVPTGSHRVVIAYNGKVGEKEIVVSGTAENNVAIAASPIPVDLTIQLKDTKPVTPISFYVMTIIGSLIAIILLVTLLIIHRRRHHES
jgi:fibronectin-binding autotransporter adhesin